MWILTHIFSYLVINFYRTNKSCWHNLKDADGGWRTRPHQNNYKKCNESVVFFQFLDADEEREWRMRCAYTWEHRLILGAINTTRTPFNCVNLAKWSIGWQEPKLVQPSSIFKNATYLQVRHGIQCVPLKMAFAEWFGTYKPSPIINWWRTT